MKNALCFLLATLPASLSAAEFPPQIPAEEHDALIAAKIKEVDEVIAAGPFKPNAESLRKIGIPEWYADAKFGIFIHWGVYSVPAFGSEWYPRNMYKPGTPEYEFHQKTYGPVSEFGYKDFIPMFKAENFDATAWAKLFKESGAKYVMPVAEHHDGFSLYDNPFTRWDSVQLGPKRDIIAELSEAIKAEDLKFAVSSHRAFNWAYFFRTEGADNTNPEFFDLYSPDQPYLYPGKGDEIFQGNHRHTWVSDEKFRDDWLARTADLVDRYKPDVIWFDFGIGRDKNGTTEGNDHYALNQKFAAYYYNQAAKTGQEIAINYKWNAYEDGEAMLDIERGKLAGIRPELWQTDTSVSYTSWGYVTNHKYKPVNVMVDDLIDIVSKNGVMLLNIGPKPDGTIPDEEQAMLREIGTWLETNGEGIYSSRPWKTFGEGSTTNAEGAHQEHKQKGYTTEDIRFTTRDNAVYAFLMEWPEKSITIKSLALGNPNEKRAVVSVDLLGGSALDFKQTDTGLVVTLPAEAPTPHASCLRIKFGN
ncbi:MAG: alpha-L-fucosidase [Akkermansiaceae bacterium]|jgi:alpha-L-fucosidase|nr:alpha-L-fucosidase [Akkermansiaceae bacterium]MDP4721380.1 alpha-L-fucosidase [Akkermansiaceae bacterium]MDP4779399.1 alpha-L-fucosidase [Akkermansiaceae bacterium]MDP4846739.1 alpha-L-fucosidase [Akkermansiaceae bacterium]MDP4897076.1 alpha-L-fucosidase [Akkermansiaceae bacterium]